MDVQFLFGISALISITIICVVLYFLGRKIKMGNKRFMSEGYIMMVFLLLPLVLIFLTIIIFEMLVNFVN